MRTSILIAALAASVGFAADAFAQTPPWNGAYIGINGGGGWGSSSQTDDVIPLPPPPPPPPPPKKPPPQETPGDGSHRVGGGLFGGGAGYNFIHGSLLAGIEGDIDWSGIDGASATCGGTHECGASLDWVATVRGRLGTIIDGTTLVYATGGLAVGDINAYDLTVPGFSGSKTKVGWTAGAGVEHKLHGPWSVKLEYLYMDFGKSEYFTITGHTPEVVGFDVHTVRVGINYSLGDLRR